MRSRKKIAHLILCLISFLIRQKSACADNTVATSDTTSPMWNMKFANPNLCARESRQAATSFYMMVDGFELSRMAFGLAAEAKEDPATDVTEAVTEYQRANLKISQTILSRLASGSLAILSDDQLGSLKASCGDDAKCDSAQKFLKTQFENQGTEANDVAPNCTLIKKNIPMQFRTAAPDSAQLEQLAIAYLDSQNYIERCDSLMQHNALDFDLVLHFDLGENKNLKSAGFRFWDSYRAYLSWAWRHSDIIDSVAPQFKDTLKSLAIESQILLIPEGCESLSRPECNSDFLSENDLRNFANGVDFGGGSKITSHSMLDDLAKAQANSAKDMAAATPSDGIITSKVLKGIMDARLEASNSVYESLLFVTTLNQNKKSNVLVDDIQALINDPKNSKQALNDLAVMCTERILVSNEQASGLAKELNSQEALFQNLDKKSIGLNSTQAVLAAHDYLVAFDSLCAQYAQQISTDDKTLITPKAFRPWFQKSITTLNLPNATNVAENQTPTNIYLALGSKVLCQDPIDCARNLLESYVNLYNVSLYSKTLSGDATQSVNFAPNRAAQVACQVYNPFAFEQLRKKKLVTDLVSAVISGVLDLPFYLKVDYQIPKFSTFSQLVSDGHVDYDPKLVSEKSLKTLVIDFGAWASAPCALIVSQNPALSAGQSVYAFHGISANYCAQKGDKDVKGDVYGLDKPDTLGHSTCGSCTISFEQVAVGAVASGFNAFRFGIRLVDALNDFFRSGKSSEIPRELEVNPKYVADAYLKYNSIPDDCVYELAHNARCMKDLCVSSTVGQYEKATGHSIIDAYAADVQQAGEGRTQKYIWMKPEGCDGEIGVPVVCEKNKVPSFVNFHALMKTMSCRSFK